MLTCPRCRGAFAAGRTDQVYCSQFCKSAAHKARSRQHVTGQQGKAQCRACGRAFATIRKVGRPAEYCSEACHFGRVAPVARPCEHCGVAFLPDAAHAALGQRFCSKPCREAWWLAAKNADYRSRAQVYELICAGCGETFSVEAVTPRPTSAGSGSRRFCTVACANRYHFRKLYGAGGGRRHGRVNGKARLAVFERDGWRCQLCHAVVDRSLAYPSPGSVSIDHAIPLALGGEHEPFNWQTAHLACNVEKGARERLSA